MAATDTANTTSVSTVLIRIFRWPQRAVWLACNIMRLSASSWLYGESESGLCSRGLLKMDSPLVITSPFLVQRLYQSLDKKSNSSVLFLLTRRKSLQFPGMTSSATTRLRTPFLLCSSGTFEGVFNVSIPNQVQTCRIAKLWGNVWDKNIRGIFSEVFHSSRL